MVAITSFRLRRQHASLTISWDTNDPDGGGAGLRYRIWLDGNEANYDSTTLNTFTVPSIDS
jgi:hypothetical protein